MAKGWSLEFSAILGGMKWKEILVKYSLEFFVIVLGISVSFWLNQRSGRDARSPKAARGIMPNLYCASFNLPNKFMKTPFPIIACALFIASCSSPLDKPIIEELSIEELAKVIERDSSFSVIYDNLENIREPLLSSATQQVKWKDFTYADIVDYQATARDSVLYGTAEKLADEKWRNEYLDVAKSVLDTVRGWNSSAIEFLDHGTPQSLVKVEPYSINTESYGSGIGVRSVDIKFKCTPLVDGIEQFSFYYDVYPKYMKRDSVIAAERRAKVMKGSTWYPSLTLDNGCLYSKALPRVAYGRFEAPYDLEKRLSYETVKSLSESYEVVIYADDVMIDGNVIDHSWSMPYAVGRLIEHFEDTIPSEPEPDDFVFSTNASSIAESVFDREFMDIWAIRTQIWDSILQSRHPEASELLEEITRWERKELEADD